MFLAHLHLKRTRKSFSIIDAKDWVMIQCSSIIKNTYSRSANPFNLFFTKNPLNLFPQVCWDFLIVKDLMVKSLTPGEWVWYTAALLVDRKRTTVSAGFCRHLIHTGEMKKRIHQVHLKRTHLWGTLKWEFHLQDTQFAMLEQLANEKTNQH